MSDIRKGDTICGADGRVYTVRAHDWQLVDAVSVDGRKRSRAFRHGDLECVDPDDGLWAEIAGGGNAAE